MSLRNAHNRKCRSCIYDCKASGSWKAQITLCSVWRCPLWVKRPTTKSIPDSVLKYYGIAPGGLEEELASLEEKAQKHAFSEVT